MARLLGRTFHDTDEIIEARFGMSISEMFSRHGEQHFRRVELEVLAELARGNHAVIATGGGTLLADAGVETAAETGIIFCLHADLSELAARLRGKTDRPLLPTCDRGTALHDLRQQRETAYRRLPNQIDTTNVLPRDVAMKIIARFEQLTNTSAGRK